MRLKIALLAAATAVTLLPAMAPASAQAYRGAPYRDCTNARANNQAAGAVLGAVIGGVLGSNAAARGHRGDGTAVGAVIGGLAGSEIGRGSTDCRSASVYNDRRYDAPYAPPPPYGPAPYGDNELSGGPGYGYNAYPDDEYAGVYTDRYDMSQRSRVDDRDRRQYTGPSDYAGRECSSAKQITRLPDGTEIRRPVQACRDTYYGDWEVEN